MVGKGAQGTVLFYLLAIPLLSSDTRTQLRLSASTLHVNSYVCIAFDITVQLS